MRSAMQRASATPDRLAVCTGHSGTAPATSLNCDGELAATRRRAAVQTPQFPRFALFSRRTTRRVATRPPLAVAGIPMNWNPARAPQSTRSPLSQQNSSSLSSRVPLAPLARTQRGSASALTASALTASAAPAPPAVILYGVPADVAAECERVAGELRLARAEVKHLQAACVALKAHPKAMLVASSSIRSWDRAVVEEHAARAGIPLRWVDADHTPDDVATEVRTWATDTMRRSRASAR